MQTDPYMFTQHFVNCCGILTVDDFTLHVSTFWHRTIGNNYYGVQQLLNMNAVMLLNKQHDDATTR